ncbi:MAG: deoxyguanosinetriphosphate triphosphohydrolase [Ruminiclostridium sp.]|nr:deoxyguanosinetriphosphate triphosphohydrolase [Ruminiclostridium sp.]
MLPREITQENEKKILSRYACLSESSKGRQRYEEPCPLRTDFQRDRDRIIHSNAFRRLKHKTQVFLIPKSDHYRTRLTHTLEVSQIARTIARALRLNEDLTEAIALGHDLGHTPFGHDGERMLQKLCPENDFRHFKQSLRVVDRIERDGAGLNLTYEVRNGILCHTNMEAETLEGVAVKFADKIAYLNHDIEDAVRGGVLDPADIPGNVIATLGDTKSRRITTLVSDIIENSGEKICYSDRIRAAHDELRSFMFGNVYSAEAINREKDKACNIVDFLFHYYMKNKDAMPELYIRLADEDGPETAVCDFISCMTDEYAIDLFKELCIPKQWIAPRG